MNFIRWILYPFALLYGIITWFRNKFYDLGIFKVYSIPIPSIVVGNLSVGGTGKTPHVAFLVSLLQDKLRLAILSRGYGRKSKGFFWVNTDSSSIQVGDEPLTYKRKFKDKIQVAVCESRKKGVQEILKNQNTDLIILDDAFQHRAVKGGLNILLTTYSDPFFEDHMLPTGNLREFQSGKQRADLIIVTKCPDIISEYDKEKFYKYLKFNNKRIFFSSVSYDDPVAISNHNWTNVKTILLVTGIANPEPLVEHYIENYKIEHISFSDHHDFSARDIKAIHQKFDTFAREETVILTTEKDYARLLSSSLMNEAQNYPWFYVPITIKLDDEENFKSIIDQYVGTV
jgi:tetraacyldisaccharide 4'-kinase